VEQRQNEKQVYEDTLHYRINIARLLALSHLDTHFGGERYQVTETSYWQKMFYFCSKLCAKTE
jgi:hypothetical protein